MVEELRPYVREYGGVDDRWCWCRTQFTEELWNLICDGHGRDYEFAEYATEGDAWAALGKACDWKGSGKIGRWGGIPARTYRPQQPIYVTQVHCPRCSDHPGGAESAKGSEDQEGRGAIEKRGGGVR